MVSYCSVTNTLLRLG